MKHVNGFLISSVIFFSMMSGAQAETAMPTQTAATDASKAEANAWAGKKIFLDPQGDPVVYDLRSGTRPTVFVLIHGLGDDMTKLDGLTNLILKDGFGVLRVDLQGHGLSLQAYMRNHKALPAEMTYQKNVEGLASLINRMQMQDIVIVGHSYGGGIAYGLAAALANNPVVRIRSVHMLAPYVQRIDKFMSEYYQSPDFLMNQTNKAVTGGATGSKSITNTNPVAAYVNMFAQTGKLMKSSMNKMFALDQTKDFLMDPFVNKFMQKSYREYFLKEMNQTEAQLTNQQKTFLDLRVEAAIRTTKGIRGFDLLDVGNVLPVVKAPIQIVGGSSDQLVVPDQLEAFDQRLTQSQMPHELSFVQGTAATHLFPRMMPNETYQKIVQFQSQH
jgi:pimeloyl-ACP methyl ester carboxylesterase